MTGRRYRQIPLLPVAAQRQMRYFHGGGRHVEQIEFLGQRLDDDPDVVEIAGEQPLVQRRARQLQPLRPQVRDGGKRGDFDFLFGHAFDAAQEAMLARFGESDGGSLAAGTPRSADAVHVCVR